MCEITLLKTERFTVEQLTQISTLIYESQRSALGIVSVYDTNGRFEYEVFRAVDPEESEIEAFLEDNMDSMRTIIHGRLATSGERNIVGAHPIPIDCPECDVDYVIHNGIVSQDDYMRDELRDEGHEFTSQVDTEVIAHLYSCVPEDINEAQTIEDQAGSATMQPAFILLSEDRLYIKISGSRWGSYVVTDEIELYKTHRWFAKDNYTGPRYNTYIVTPVSEPDDQEQEQPVTV